MFASVICYATKPPFSFPFNSFSSVSFLLVFFLILFLLVPFSFILIFTSFSSSTYFSTMQNPPSERANFKTVSFAYTASISEAALRGFSPASPPTSPACSSWTRVYVLRWLQFYCITFVLYINAAADRFSLTRCACLSALHWFPLAILHRIDFVRT